MHSCHTIIRETDQRPQLPSRPVPRLVEDVKGDVGEQGGNDASDTMGNFEFDVALPYVKGEKRGRRVHHSK